MFDSNKKCIHVLVNSKGTKGYLGNRMFLSHPYILVTKFPSSEAMNGTSFPYIFQKYSVHKQACTCIFVLFCSAWKEPYWNFFCAVCFVHFLYLMRYRLFHISIELAHFFKTEDKVLKDIDVPQLRLFFKTFLVLGILC